MWFGTSHWDCLVTHLIAQIATEKTLICRNMEQVYYTYKICQLSFPILELADSCDANLFNNHSIKFSLINVTFYYKLSTL